MIRTFVVLHKWKNVIIGAEVFQDKAVAEQWIEDQFEHNPALDYKDSFYIREIVIGGSREDISGEDLIGLPRMQAKLYIAEDGCTEIIDANDEDVARFSTEAKARAWCEENGYVVVYTEEEDADN